MSHSDSLVRNTLAIALIQSGHCKEAITMIKEALVMLQPHFNAHADENRGVDASPALQEFDAFTRVAQQQQQQDEPELQPYISVPILADDEVDVLPVLSLDDNIFSFYPRMFCIQQTDITKFHAGKVFILLLYNLAMAHHIDAAMCCAQWEGRARQSCLDIVLELYQTVPTAVLRCLRPDEVGDIMCALVAAGNNAGHLNGYLGNFQQVNLSLQMQLQLLNLCYGEYSIPMQDYKVFFSSIMTTIEGPGLSVPPAA